MNEHSAPTAAAPAAPIEVTAAPASPAGERSALDLDVVARDLDGVEAALTRLDAGTYWTDEITGAPIPDEQLAADPVTRRAG